MRVCFFNNYDVDPNTGGVNRVTHNLALSLSSQSVECYLAYIENDYQPANNFNAKIKIYDMRKDIVKFRLFLKNNAIDLIHVNYLKRENLYILPYLYHTAQELGIPVVQAFHMAPGYELNGYSTFDYLWYNIIHRKTFGASLKHFVGYHCKNILSPLYRKFLRGKYHYI